MGRQWPPVCLAAAVCLTCLVSCQTARKKLPHPDDPLLLSKKPVAGKHETARSALLARAEPVVPVFPSALVAAPSPRARPSVVDRPPVNLATPTSRPPSQIVRATPAVRRRVSGTYGHAEDFSWVQGVLTRGPDETLQLRYLAPSAEMPHEGVVLLEPDPRLAAFATGDVVLVEGDGLEQAPPRRYRVRSLWLVRRGE